MTGGQAGALCISVVSLDDSVINITGERNRPRIVSLSARRGVSGGWERGVTGGPARRQRRSVVRISATDNAKQSWQRDNATRALVAGPNNRHRAWSVRPTDDHVQRRSGHAGSPRGWPGQREHDAYLSAPGDQSSVEVLSASDDDDVDDWWTDSSDRRTDRLTDHRTAATSLTNQSLSSTRCSRWQVVVANIRVYRPFVR